MARVEVAGPGSENLRRNDTAGKIVVGREELLQFGDNALSGGAWARATRKSSSTATPRRRALPSIPWRRN
jgi:hypothetical protein